MTVTSTVGELFRTSENKTEKLISPKKDPLICIFGIDFRKEWGENKRYANATPGATNG